MRLRAGAALLAGVTLSPGSAAGADLPPGLESLRRAERAFARATAEVGVRNGFLLFFDEAAIAPPSLEPARVGLLAQPAPAGAPAGLLEWEPLVGDIARSGDLGYLTGPSTYTGADGKPRHGVYFSVWRRPSSGVWRVVLDAGCDQPSPPPEFADSTFRVAGPPSGWAPPDSAAASRAAPAELRAAEGELLAAARGDLAQALAPRLAEHARMHREGHHPFLGRAAILAELGRAPVTLTGEIHTLEVSSAGDLGYTIGPATLSAGGEARRGVFSRVWRRDPAGRWRVVLDVFNPERRR